MRFKNEMVRNITIKLGYANAKIFKVLDSLTYRFKYNNTRYEKCKHSVTRTCVPVLAATDPTSRTKRPVSPAKE